MADQNQGDQQGDPLLFNKIAAAGLTVLLLVFGLPQLAKAIIGGGHHKKGEELHLAYCCVDLEIASHGAGGDEEPAFDLATALASANPASGERRSAICASCHTFEKGGADGTGPHLWDIVGREVGGVAGYGYTAALQSAGGVWTYERLDAYIKNSQEYLPGTAMVQRFPRDAQRVDILAYLGTLSDNPVPFPEPAVVAAPEEEGLLEEAAEAVEGAVEDAGNPVEEAVETVEDAIDGQ